ncbi:MAG: hypothetical protein IH874_09385 [Candidatus Dadabacteria bacterium]|nr:hypothetical protein [Candidatus Dadabacteria bacterium]
MKEIVIDIYTWSWLSPKHGYNFNGFAIKSREGLVVIDPPTIEDPEREALESIGTPSCILLTNKDHERSSIQMKKLYDCPIYIHEDDAPRLGFEPDETFKNDDKLPGGLLAVNIPNNKTPGETALLLPRHEGTLFIGDAVIGWPPGEFSLLPAEKYRDPLKTQQSLKTLLKYDYSDVLVGDGESVLKVGKDALLRLYERTDVHLTLPVS